MSFRKNIFFCLGMLVVSLITGVHSIETKYNSQIGIINDTNKKIYEEYEQLRKDYPITKFDWRNGNILKTRAEAIRKKCNLDDETWNVKLILFVERLYDTYSNPSNDTYRLLFDTEVIYKTDYQDDFVKKITNFITWIRQDNKDFCYLVQMPFIMSNLLHDIELIKNNEFKKRLCLRISDEMWCTFLFEDIKNDYWTVFEAKRYVNCKQRHLDIVMCQIASFCQNFLEAIKHFENESSYDMSEDEEDNEDSFYIMNEHDIKIFRDAIFASYIYKKKKDFFK